MRDMKAAYHLIPAWFAASVAISYGSALIVFAAAAWPGVDVGAGPLVFLDVLIGVMGIVSGFALLFKKEWGRQIIREGALAVTLFEAGRRLAPVGSVPELSTFIHLAILVVVLCLARISAGANTTAAYTSRDVVLKPLP